MAYAAKAVIAVVMLAACCARLPAPRAIELRTVDVARPVPVACLKPDDVPVRPDHVHGARPSLLEALASLLQWDGAGGYGDQAEAVMRRCARP
jgi:hypothetical protein